MNFLSVIPYLAPAPGFVANALRANAFLGKTTIPIRWAELTIIVIEVGPQALSGRGQ